MLLTDRSVLSAGRASRESGRVLVERLPDRVVVTLDRPEALPPEYHSWVASRIAWFDTADALPRFLDGGPDAV